ncbi:MAG: hypothetical protein R3E76_06105 [Planctomycetota bacterium]
MRTPYYYIVLIIATLFVCGSAFALVYFVHERINDAEEAAIAEAFNTARSGTPLAEEACESLRTFYDEGTFIPARYGVRLAQFEPSSSKCYIGTLAYFGDTGDESSLAVLNEYRVTSIRNQHVGEHTLLTYLQSQSEGKTLEATWYELQQTGIKWDQARGVFLTP